MSAVSYQAPARHPGLGARLMAAWHATSPSLSDSLASAATLLVAGLICSVFIGMVLVA